MFTPRIAKRRLALAALTALLAGSATLGLIQRQPAEAGGLSINIGAPVYVPYNDYRYHHDRAYHDRYDRSKQNQDHHHHH